MATPEEKSPLFEMVSAIMEGQRSMYEMGANQMGSRLNAYRSLVAHILAMADDSYLTGHPEWNEIVNEARRLL